MVDPKIKDIFYKKTNLQSDMIKYSLEGLKSNDDIEILNCLYELSSNLSLANDTIAEDPNCISLIKELVVQLDKYSFFPELTIIAMQCINLFLDINPRFSSTIVKAKGIKKIVLLTQNIEFIDLAENAIKCIEKLSLEILMFS